MSEKLLTPIEIGLTAAIVAIEGNEPVILTASAGDDGKLAGLPFGPFDAVRHRTFEIVLITITLLILLLALWHGWRARREAERSAQDKARFLAVINH